MKNYISLLFSTLFLLLSAVQCREPVEAERNTLSVSPTVLEFGVDGGIQVVDLRTDAGSWAIEQQEGSDWLTPERTSGRTSTSVSIEAGPNGESVRKAVLTFSAPGCDPVEVTVTQEGSVAAGFEGEDIVPSPAEWDGKKRAAISYQALVYSFADGDGDRKGDFKGLVSKLDYLDGLGVSAIWLSPIHPSSSYHGYDVKDYTAVNPEFGTESDFQTLVDKAHDHGIKVYLDYVLNHTSKDHPWFLSAVSSPEGEYGDFYALSKNPQQDIADGKIAQIATEGAAGYDAGQWFASTGDAGAEGMFTFTLDWTDESAPVVTVTETAGPADEDNAVSATDDRYLYFGEGVCKRFYKTSAGKYELTVDFSSDWGFLIRTDENSWDAGTKYGAPDASTIIEFGKPFRLVSNMSSDPANIQFSLPLMYHSHFWTDWFADLNYGAAEEAEQSAAFKAVTEAGDKWVKMGVDGFRLDAVKHIYHNQSSDENPVFLGKFYDRMNETYKSNGGEGDFYMVGEMLDEASNAAPYYRGLPALFEFSFWYRLKYALQNNTGMYFIKDILSYAPLYSQYRRDYIEATKLSNHDEDRTGSDLGQNLDKMKLAAAVLLTAPGEPYIYQGEELGYWGVKANGDEYVRTPILWNKSGSGLADGSLSGKVDRNMLQSSISVEAQEESEESILNVYKRFSRLRNTYPALAEGRAVKHDVYNENNAGYPGIAVWYMVSDTQKILVVHNFGEEDTVIELSDSLDKPIGLLGVAQKDSGEGTSRLLIGGYSSVVFEI